MNIVKICAVFAALSVCIFCVKFCCIFLESFLCMQIKLELLSPGIVSALKTKELLSHFRVCRCRERRTDNDERTVTHWFQMLRLFLLC